MTNDSSATADIDPAGLRSALSTFLDQIDRAVVTEDILARIGGNEAEVSKRLDTYLNEAFVGLDLVAAALPEATDVLEIGAGVGALSAFLSTQGWNVVAVEPVGTGFDFVGAARQSLSGQWGAAATPQVLDIDAARLGPEHGEFDLAFSVHVLEHVTDLDGVITAVQQRLRPTGRAVHTCPNYTVPYEPHFGVPLVPVRPALTRRLLPRRIGRSALWESLNFVTASDIRRIARRSHMAVEFELGIMAASAKRVESDADFRERQGVAGKLAALTVSSRPGHWLLERWPARISTPMVFTVSGTPAGTSSGRSFGPLDAAPTGSAT